MPGHRWEIFYSHAQQHLPYFPREQPVEHGSNEFPSRSDCGKQEALGIFDGSCRAPARGRLFPRSCSEAISPELKNLLSSDKKFMFRAV